VLERRLLNDSSSDLIIDEYLENDHLIEAFKSTLEEAKYADIIFHVVDSSNPQRDKQMHIVYETLDNLGVKDKKIVTLFNKQDARTDDEPLRDFRADKTLAISAAKNEGLEEVKAVLEEMLREDKVYIERVIPYTNAGIIQLIRKQGELISEEYVAEGIEIKAYVPMEVYGKID
jgi:GTP-binding protein HflX